MPARAMWIAEIAFGSLRVPVKLYAAVQNKSIHFRLLHETDLQPVAQKMVDPVREQPVAKEDIRVGLEVEPGVYVVLTDEERESLEPPESREIAVEQAVSRDLVDERWYDRPYYLGPDGDLDDYFALAEALASSDTVAIARWTMRKQQYVGALHDHRGYLMLETLRNVEDMVQLGAFKTPISRSPDPRELALAEQIIASLEDEFDPDDYQDEHRQEVLDLIESKASGKIIAFPKPTEKPREETSLLDALEASLRPKESVADAS